jgi:hypothetical protein
MNCDDPIMDCPKAGNGCGCRLQAQRIKRLIKMALRVDTPEAKSYAAWYEASLKRMEPVK